MYWWYCCIVPIHRSIWIDIFGYIVKSSLPRLNKSFPSESISNPASFSNYDWMRKSRRRSSHLLSASEDLRDVFQNCKDYVSFSNFFVYSTQWVKSSLRSHYAQIGYIRTQIIVLPCTEIFPSAKLTCVIWYRKLYVKKSSNVINI